MVSLAFDHGDFHSLLKELSVKLGAVLQQDVLRIPPSMGSGYMRAVRLPNGLSVLVSNISMQEDIKLHRMKKIPAFYLLAFDEVFIRSRLEQKIDQENVIINPPIYSAAALHSTCSSVRDAATMREEIVRSRREGRPVIGFLLHLRHLL